MLTLAADAIVTEIEPKVFDVLEINSIQDKHKGPRQKSKVPTFAMTYDGTVNTLMTGSGFTREEATRIYNAYHELYIVSDQWVAAQLDEAARVGYVTVAFGLRVRTPLLKQVIRKTSKTPYEAEAEGRSAGNALGQSWCLLNSRAGTEFNGKVRTSKYRLDIKPCAQIHDAQYHLYRDDPEVIAWANEHLVKATFWQEHPLIAHPEVNLGGELSLFYPTWANEITLPNGAKEEEIIKMVEAEMAKRGK